MKKKIFSNMILVFFVLAVLASCVGSTTNTGKSNGTIPILKIDLDTIADSLVKSWRLSTKDIGDSLLCKTKNTTCEVKENEKVGNPCFCEEIKGKVFQGSNICNTETSFCRLKEDAIVGNGCFCSNRTGKLEGKISLEKLETSRVCHTKHGNCEIPSEYEGIKIGSDCGCIDQRKNKYEGEMISSKSIK